MTSAPSWRKNIHSFCKSSTQPTESWGGLYLAGPALVKSAIGQDVSHEELGGAEMHATISGTIDFREPDDAACLKRLRSLAAALP